MIFRAFVFVCCVCVSNAYTLFGVEGERRIEPHTDISTECTDYAAWGKCEFYQCLEERFPCGHNGFNLKYMKYFCDRMTVSVNNFDKKGQRWLNRTAVCITENIFPEYKSTANRCDDIEKSGIAAMLTCNALVDETGTDICDVVTENFGAYRDMFGTEGFSRIVSLGNARLKVAFMDGLGRCGEGQLEERISDLIQQIEGNYDTQSSLWN